MQSNDEALSPQDAVDSFDNLRAGHVAFRFTSEPEAEQWEHDGRVDDAASKVSTAPTRRT